MPNSTSTTFKLLLLVLAFFVTIHAVQAEEQHQYDTGYPQPAVAYKDKQRCEKRCNSILSLCREVDKSFVCEMDKTLLIVIVVMAILTGVLIPVLCISLYVCGIFAYVSHRLSKVAEDEEMLNDDKRRRGEHGSHDGTMETEIREKPVQRPGIKSVDFSESSYNERYSEEEGSGSGSQQPINYRSMSERPGRHKNPV